MALISYLQIHNRTCLALHLGGRVRTGVQGLKPAQLLRLQSPPAPRF